MIAQSVVALPKDKRPFPSPPPAFYLADMLQRTLPAGFIAPCLPTKTTTLPSGSQWLHEIKHDGFRIIARKSGSRVRLYSRRGIAALTALSTVADCCQIIRVLTPGVSPVINPPPWRESRARVGPALEK
jgi:hypothetical protein